MDAGAAMRQAMNLLRANPPLTPPRRGTIKRAPLPSWEGLGVSFKMPVANSCSRGLSPRRHNTRYGIRANSRT